MIPDEVITAVVAALIVSLPAYLGWWTTRKRIQQIHVSVNSRMDELVKSTAKASHAEGVTEGRREEKQDPVKHEHIHHGEFED